MYKVLLLVFFIYLRVVHSVLLNIPVCEVKLEKNITDGVILPNNSIIHQGLLYNENNYFYYNYTNQPEYVGCPCNFNRCYRKCCTNNEILNENYDCVPSNRTTDIHEIIYQKDIILNNVSIHDFVQIEGRGCHSGRVVSIGPGEKGEYYLQEDGSLFYVVENYEFERDLGDYCIDLMGGKRIALACIFEETEENTILRNSYGGLMILTSPFLLATFLLYILIPELRETTHGKCIASYSISLFFGTFLMGIIYLISQNLSQPFCVGSAFLSYGGYMASFLWLNVMCIDIWWKSGGLKINMSRERKFTIYSIYAWGSITLALIIALTLQYMDRKLVPPYIVKPEIGVMRCWFGSIQIQGYYMYGPLLVLIVINCILFILTVVNIWRLKKQSDKTPGHIKYYVSEFSFYLILFFAFGLNWSFELIPWLTNNNYEFLTIFDVINILYGMFLFILACCNKKVRGLIITKLRCSKKHPKNEPDTMAFSTENPADIILR